MNKNIKISSQNQNPLEISSDDFLMGSHFGHQSLPITSRSAWNPNIATHHLGLRNNIAFLNPVQTQKSLLRAFYVLAGVLKNKGHVVVINTSSDFTKLSNYVSGYSFHNKNNQEQNQYLFLDSLSVSSCYYKWVSGTLTNYKQVSKSIHSYVKFSQFFTNNQGEEDKELDFPRYHKVKKSFQGYLRKDNNNTTNNNKRNTMKMSLPEKPDLIFIMNPLENQNAIFEANKLHIPVIALTQTNTDCKGIDYPIPCNPSVEFTYYIFKKIIQLCHIYK